MPPSPRGKQEVVRSIEIAQGNIRRAAMLMGITRVQLYRYIARYELWLLVNAERKRRLEQRPQEGSMLHRTRDAFRG